MDQQDSTIDVEVRRHADEARQARDIGGGAAMPVTKWIRHPTFPAANSTALNGGALFTVWLREWAFGKVIAQGLVSGEEVRSSDTKVIAGSNWPRVAGHITTDFHTGEVSFLARESGATVLYAVNKKGESVGPAVTIVVQERRGSADNKLSQTPLAGKTFAVNAPDTKTYEMETTVTFSSTMEPVTIFERVSDDTDHVVLSSHGAIPEGLTSDNFNLSMLIAGKKEPKRRLDLENVVAAFTPLQSKLSENAVIWLGSCSIGHNLTFCQRAADASGRTVVAATGSCPIVKYPKNKIDLLDRQATIKVFTPGGKLKSPSEFCAEQVARKFTLPV